MSTVVTHLVQPNPPSNPSLQCGMNKIPLPPITLWPYGPIPTILTFPGEIDLERLRIAVQEVTALWPITVGRYIKKEKEGNAGSWSFSIDLTASPFPLETQTITTIDPPFPTAKVIQPTAAPYLPTLQPDSFLPNTNAALVAIRLTTLLPAKTSVLGILWTHIISDASSSNRFNRDLSYFYTRENATASMDHPTFFPHVSLSPYPPSQEVVKKYSVLQVDPKELGVMREAYVEDAKISTVMEVSLTREEMKAMKHECAVALSASDADKDLKLSDQDVISAWWTSLLVACGVEVRSIVYSMNYRGFHKGHPSFPPNLPSLCGNVATQMKIPLPRLSSPHDDAIHRRSSIARSIRMFLNGVRSDVDVNLEKLAVSAWKMEQAAIAGQAQVSLPHDGEVLINSNLRYNWLVAFGFPSHEVAYHTTWSAMNHLRVFEGNPKRGNEGEGSDIELTWNVVKEGSRRAQMEHLVAEDKKRWKEMCRTERT